MNNSQNLFLILVGVVLLIIGVAIGKSVAIKDNLNKKQRTALVEVKEVTDSNASIRSREFVYRGHDYFLFSWGHGMSVQHSPECKCNLENHNRTVELPGN